MLDFSTKIYVVMATQGEWSDRTEWPICGFVNEDSAKAKIITLQKEAEKKERPSWEDVEGYFYYTVGMEKEDPYELGVKVAAMDEKRFNDGD